MTTPEYRATIFCVAVIAIVMTGMAIHFWNLDHDWRTVAIPLIMGIICVPIAIFKGRYIANAWFGKDNQKKN